MRLVSIDTTPNPNSMKLNLDESVGKPMTYTREKCADCPDYVAKLLDIAGVQSIFVCQDFITLNKDPRTDWRSILDVVAHSFRGPGERSEIKKEEQRQAAEKLGQVSVVVQTFRGIPIQVKATDTESEKRVALDSRLSDAAAYVQTQTGADYLKERYWADWGLRYGSLEEVVTDVVEEIQGTLDAKALERLVANALGQPTEAASPRSLQELQAELSSEDWHQRLQAVQELGSAEGSIPVLIEALKDSNHQVRRLAAAALGASGSESAVSPLSEVFLTDPSVGVRRTAGDALSDLGSVAAQPAACKALSDPNKLVRWRAARLLSDVGTVEAIPYLQAATNDTEFEVRLEIEAAIDRISGGKEGSMPVWKKILKG